MASKREREYARRRYEKQNARLRKAAQLRRERRMVVLFTILGFAVLIGGVVFVNNRAATEDPSAGATDLTEAPTSDAASTDPLPTTDPVTYDAPPPASDSLGADWDVTMTTSIGDITMVLHGAEAPQSVANFVFLAQEGFYDGTACHRLLPDSLLQCGDPSATGQGGPGYSWGPIENAPEDNTYPTGTVAMARVSNDGESMGSQFFLVFNDVELPSDSAGGYSVFGEITGGLDILQQLGAAGTIDGSADGRPAIDVVITGVEVTAHE